MGSLARSVSIAGHPAVLMPAAALSASPGRVAGAALFISLACATAVVAYSLYKVRRGAWAHMDASVPAERAQLNSLVGTGLLAAAGVLSFTDLHVGVPAVVGLSGLIVIAGRLLHRVAKLSLHVGFAAFAACLVWPNHIAFAAFALVAIAVSWSRLALCRHVPTDIIVGVLAGVSAGLVFHGLMARIAA